MDAEKALAAALTRMAYGRNDDPDWDPSAALDTGDFHDADLSPAEFAAAILAALPPDWCGHEAEIARLRAALERIADGTLMAHDPRSLARAALDPQPA